MASGKLALMDWRLSAAATIYPLQERSHATAFSVLHAAVSGRARVGGIAGFNATVTGAFDVAQQTAQFSVIHAGGWSPLQGEFAAIIQTPAFTSSLNIGVGGIAVNFEGTATLRSPIDFGASVSLSSHPNIAAQGPRTHVRLVQLNNDSEAVFNVTLSSGLRLFGNVAQAPPPLAVEGLLESTGVVTLFVSTAAGWSWEPIATVRALSFPAMGGTIRLDVPNNVVDMSVRSLSAVSASLNGVAALSNAFAYVRAQLNISDATVGATVLTLSGDVVVPRLNHLRASMVGTVDLIAARSTLTLLPVRDWSPLPPPFEPYFTIPSFEAVITLGLEGVPFLLVGNATLPSVTLHAGCQMCRYDCEP
jgi:hypothetical protein